MSKSSVSKASSAPSREKTSSLKASIQSEGSIVFESLSLAWEVDSLISV
jgi:hypothetical protein